MGNRLRVIKDIWLWFVTIAVLAFWNVIDIEPLMANNVLVPKGANGIRFDANDLLYIASLKGNEIFAMDPSTGVVLKRIGFKEGVKTPDDLAFGPDGSLYWTSFDTGKVCRISPEGLRSEQMLAPGVNPIAFSHDGRLFVSVAYRGDVLF
jgi:sugar lactone lactonase YvrE